MFSSGSPYSPFFTSGLLSAPPQDYPRRGSLPTDALSASTSRTKSEFYYHRDRSFLSLDLAESVKTAPTSSLLAPQVLRVRYSRDSLRSIPSPKPAPSSTLPELPKSATTPLASTSALPALSISRTEAPTGPTVPLPPKRLPSRKSTTSSVSTRARRRNRSNALDRLEGRARPLASTTPYTAPPSITKFSMRRNFMSMSDDESDDDDDESDIDSLGAKSDYSDDDENFLESASDNRLFYTGYLEPEDHVLPTTSPSSSPVRSRAAPPPKRSATKDWFPLKSFIDLRTADDTSSTAPNTTSSSVSSLSISISGTTASTSPASPTSWSWRSFIDVASI